MHALCEIHDDTLPHHRFVLEPQSRQYLTHGDLWDHLYLRACDRPGMFLPLTLEMGSWLWIKKNPRQIFSRHGIFNPVIAHRQQRVLRRHVALARFHHARGLQPRPLGADRCPARGPCGARWRAGTTAGASMTTWVLLRGLTREVGHWGEFPRLLRERLPGARVLAIDLPGNGRLNRETSPLRIEAMVQHCRAQLRALGVETPVTCSPCRWAAMVAVDWARRHPRELAACVLVNTSLRPFSPWYWRLRPANYPPCSGSCAHG